MFVQVDKGGKKTNHLNNPLDTKLFLFRNQTQVTQGSGAVIETTFRNAFKAGIRCFALCDAAVWFGIRVTIKSLSLELLS